MSELSNALDQAAKILADDYDQRHPGAVSQPAALERATPPDEGRLRYVPYLALLVGVVGIVLSLFAFDAFGARERRTQWEQLRAELAAKETQYEQLNATLQDTRKELEHLGQGWEARIAALERAEKRHDLLRKNLDDATNRLTASETKLKSANEELAALKSDLIAAQSALAVLQKEVRASDTYVLKGVMTFPVSTDSQQVSLRLPAYKTKKTLKATRDTRWADGDTPKNPGTIEKGDRYVLATVRNGVLVQVDLGRAYNGKE